MTRPAFIAGVLVTHVWPISAGCDGRWHTDGAAVLEGPVVGSRIQVRISFDVVGDAPMAQEFDRLPRAELDTTQSLGSRAGTDASYGLASAS